MPTMICTAGVHSPISPNYAYIFTAKVTLGSRPTVTASSFLLTKPIFCIIHGNLYLRYIYPLGLLLGSQRFCIQISIQKSSKFAISERLHFYAATALGAKSTLCDSQLQSILKNFCKSIKILIRILNQS